MSPIRVKLQTAPTQLWSVDFGSRSGHSSRAAQACSKVQLRSFGWPESKREKASSTPAKLPTNGSQCHALQGTVFSAECPRRSTISVSGTRLESGENVGKRHTRGNSLLKSAFRNSSPCLLLKSLNLVFHLREKLESLPTRRVSYHHFSLQHILELTISSMAFAQPISCSQSPVALHEIFDMSHNSIAADFRTREELSNMRICVNLPNGVHDWEGLRSALAEEGMEITVKEDKLCISGYVSRNDYNYEREIRATVARFRRISQRSS